MWQYLRNDTYRKSHRVSYLVLELAWKMNFESKGKLGKKENHHSLRTTLNQSSCFEISVIWKTAFIIILTSQIKSLRFRDVKWLVQSHKPSEGQRQILKPSLFDSHPTLNSTLLWSLRRQKSWHWLCHQLPVSTIDRTCIVSWALCLWINGCLGLEDLWTLSVLSSLSCG